MKYDYDIITIGLGPAGMAVSIMGAEMGLKVCAVEKRSIGGECMNVGCIPSKALLRMAKARQAFDKLKTMALSDSPKPRATEPFKLIQERLKYISEKKTMKMFDKVELIYQQGSAEFVDQHTVKVGGKECSAKRIFICTGTEPTVPYFPGLEKVGYLTNETLFTQERVPESMIVIGGGAIACEMAQAFNRMGSKVTMIIRGPRLMWREDQDVTALLEQTFESEGITILREQSPLQFEKDGNRIVMSTDKDKKITAEKVLVATGRKMDYSAMALAKAGVQTTDRGAIKVNKYLQTTRKHIYACGDCNGYRLFSHAAMHQGMIALMNCMMPWPMKMDFRKYVVPWTVFTEPQASQVGAGESSLQKAGRKYEVVRVDYGDYGAAVAESVDTGFIKAFISPAGRIYGVYIIGDGSGEMINEWALAVQKKIRITDIMMLQHSFPTMGFLTKRASETWMMGKMKSPFVKKMCKIMFG